MTAVRNEHGVYQPDEVLSLPRTVKGWRGVNTADIGIADLGTHWIWSTCFQLYGGDHAGSASPLIDDNGRRGRICRQPTRDAAIKAASDHLRARMTGHDCPDARAILVWLDTLRPDQFDMFGSLAA